MDEGKESYWYSDPFFLILYWIQVLSLLFRGNFFLIDFTPLTFYCPSRSSRTTWRVAVSAGILVSDLNRSASNILLFKKLFAIDPDCYFNKDVPYFI